MLRVMHNTRNEQHTYVVVLFKFLLDLGKDFVVHVQAVRILLKGHGHIPPLTLIGTGPHLINEHPHTRGMIARLVEVVLNELGDLIRLHSNHGLVPYPRENDTRVSHTLASKVIVNRGTRVILRHLTKASQITNSAGQIGSLLPTKTSRIKVMLQQRRQPVMRWIRPRLIANGYSAGE